MRIEKSLGWWGTAVVALALLAARPGVAAEAPAVGGGSLLVKSGEVGGLQTAPVLRSDVRIRATGLVARVEVAQEFRNPTSLWVKGIYVFPLPEGAAVDTLSLRVGEREVRAAYFRLLVRSSAARSPRASASASPCAQKCM